MEDLRQLLQQAVALHQAGHLDDAVSRYQAVLAADPRQADALHLMGVLAHQQGDHQRGADLIAQAIAANDRRWEYYSNLACIQQRQRRYDLAVATCRRAIELEPAEASLWNNLATAYHEWGRSDEALAAYRRALELAPNLADAHYNLGNLHRERGNLADALARYQQTLELSPGHLQAQMNLANLLVQCDRPDEAIDHLRQVAGAAPQRPETFYYLGLAYKQAGRLDDALASYEVGLALNPEHVALRWARALVLLQTGQWQQGWTEYHWRWRRSEQVASRPLPVNIDGPPPGADDAVLVAAEQGLEMELLFSTCLGDLIDRVRHAVIECDPRLLLLYRRSFPTATIRPRESWNTSGPYSGRLPVDRQIALGSLPLWLRPELESFPRRPATLVASEELRDRHRERLALLGGTLKVGIAWQNAESPAKVPLPCDHLSTWLPVLATPGVTWVNLQGGPMLPPLTTLECYHGITIHDWDDCDLVHELDVVAARIAALDLVICAPGPIAHLAGALGVPAWVVLPPAAGWYWLVDRQDSPWYPSLRLWRVDRGRNWTEVFDRVAGQLQNLVAERRQAQGLSAAPARQQSAGLYAHVAQAAAARLDPGVRREIERIIALEQAGKSDEAIAAYRGLWERGCRHPEVSYRLGVLLLKAAQHPEAIELLKRAADADPTNPLIEFHLAVGLSESKLTLEASQRLRRALRLRPDFPEAQLNMGAMLERLGRADEALTFSQRGVELNPQSASCHYNLGNARLHLGDLDEALGCYARALALEPNFARAQWNRAMVLLMTRRFREGWEAWEAREDAGEVAIDHFSYPVWDGRPLDEKKIFVHAEQGIGDEVMFASCLPDVIARAKAVVIGCDPRLKQLFARSFPAATVLAFKRPKDRDWALPPDIDLSITAGSLPRLLRPRIEDFPRQHSYLVPDPALVERWRRRYAELGPGLVVGISWRAGGKSSEQKRRTSELEHWGDILRVGGVHFVNLQYGNAESDLQVARELFDVEIHDWRDCDPLKDLENFAAQVAALDQVVSVGNTTIHFAGALGIPTWTLLPQVPGWRYMIDGDELLWYRTVRLFRQTHPDDWRSLTARLGAMLVRLVADAGIAASNRPAAPPRQPRIGHGSRQAEPSAAAAEQADGPQLAERLVADQPALVSVTDILLTAIKNHQRGELADAERGYRRVLEKFPHDRNALHLLGTLNDQLDRPVEARELIERSLAVDEKQPVAHYNLAGTLRKLGCDDAALAHFRRALELQPKFPEAMLNLGALLRDRGDLDAAMDCYHRCLEVRPSYADAHFNLAVVLLDRGLFDEAAQRLERAIRYRPKFAKAWLKLAAIRKHQERFGDAAECLQRILEFAPDDALVHWNRALLLLAAGMHREGWEEWRWRDKAQAVPVATAGLPQWNGEPLDGQTLLVHAEGELEDQLLLASCLPDVARRAPRAIVRCEPPLVPLLARAFPQWSIESRRAVAAPSAAVEVSLGSLPRLLRGTRESFAASRPYLEADPRRHAAWIERVDRLGPGLKVGIAPRDALRWTAGHEFEPSPADFEPLYGSEAWHCLWLQNGAAGQPPETCHRIADDQALADLDELAALVAACDLVIAADNLTMHLAGALGTACWALLPRQADWRFPLALAESLWYPRTRIVRPPAGGSWRATIQRLAGHLASRPVSRPAVPRPHAPLSVEGATAWPIRNPSPTA